ncbi:Gat1p Ecym_1456 [Eremothecium cymbalariae DBVPG|uniref:GATA-type domain-containing protein n=1 Tax=Eremothecium cymbalariae (strain CBS 270.75 / DBVPG 7215 / KCTC 17166 / NRRL Y-17582) TaxID=931890 RepID=G8JMG5_ERECY|nr:hypothetical protein Ecym_1456 [Eremothecium cymbalariae DBVPG\
MSTINRELAEGQEGDDDRRLTQDFILDSCTELLGRMHCNAKSSLQYKNNMSTLTWKVMGMRMKMEKWGGDGRMEFVDDRMGGGWIGGGAHDCGMMDGDINSSFGATVDEEEEGGVVDVGCGPGYNINSQFLETDGDSLFDSSEGLSVTSHHGLESGDSDLLFDATRGLHSGSFSSYDQPVGFMPIDMYHGLVSGVEPSPSGQVKDGYATHSGEHLMLAVDSDDMSPVAVNETTKWTPLQFGHATAACAAGGDVDTPDVRSSRGGGLSDNVGDRDHELRGMLLNSGSLVASKFGLGSHAVSSELLPISLPSTGSEISLQDLSTPKNDMDVSPQKTTTTVGVALMTVPSRKPVTAVNSSPLAVAANIPSLISGHDGVTSRRGSQQQKFVRKKAFTKSSPSVRSNISLGVYNGSAHNLAPSSVSANKTQSDPSHQRSSKPILKSDTKCTNCHTKTTPLWRRDPQGNPLCNACGLFLKLHGVVRPLSLKTDVIKKRQRSSNRSSLGSSKNSSESPKNNNSNSNSNNGSGLSPSKDLSITGAPQRQGATSYGSNLGRRPPAMKKPSSNKLLTLTSNQQNSPIGAVNSVPGISPGVQQFQSPFLNDVGNGLSAANNMVTDPLTNATNNDGLSLYLSTEQQVLSNEQYPENSGGPNWEWLTLSL